MRNYGDLTRAVAASSFLVAACQGGGSLGQSGAAGAGGQTHPASGGSGGAGRDAGRGGSGDTGGSGGGRNDASASLDAGGGTTECTPLGAIPRRLWRLSTEQWGNAVQSLLNLPSAPVLMSRGGEPPYPSLSDASLGVDAPMLFDVYTSAGSATIQSDPLVATTIAPCIGTTAEAQTSCAMSFVQAFASRAYRRPVTEDELSDLMAVYQDGATDGYNAGVELVIKAIVASPSFLFRTELGPPTLTADAAGNYPDTTLTPDEIASQLSFTLLGTIPDAPLSAAAADGSLATRDGIAGQVNRLLALPAAQAYLTDMILKWLGVGVMFEKPKDVALLAGLSSTGSGPEVSAIENDLWTSAQMFVSSILWTGSGRVDDLFTSQAVYVNQRLATLYPDAIVPQAPSSDTTFMPGTWPTSQGRSGMLTQPSYLWALSDPSAASIVKRGKAIHDDVVCQDVLGAPVDLSTPEAVNVINCKSPDGAQTLSTCDSEVLKSDARVANQPCRVCHEQIDPYARVLQSFGPIGNYRTVDEAGRPIDPVATFFSTEPPVFVAGLPTPVLAPGSPLAPRTVTGAQGLASALISTGVLDGCAVQRLVSVATGSGVWTYDTCELGPIRAANDGTIKSLLVNVLLADFMRARAGGPK
jgi:uncharacterized protein DUF1592/uncharacterized protein DUF1595/uncharacterized protein DUF1588